MLQPPPGSAHDVNYFQPPAAHWAKATQLRRILLRNSADVGMLHDTAEACAGSCKRCIMDMLWTALHTADYAAALLCSCFMLIRLVCLWLAGRLVERPGCLPAVKQRSTT
jgi:hypothetical protein